MSARTEIFVKIGALQRMPENYRHFMKCRAGTRQSLKSGPNYLSALIAWALHGTPGRPPAFSVTITADVRVPAFFAFPWQLRFICACSVFRLRRRRGIDVKCCQLHGMRGGRGHKRLLSVLRSQPIPFFVLSKSYPPSPTPYVIWA